MHFSRGLADSHSSLIGDVADPSLQEGLRMREYTIKAGERKAGSARFAESDSAHRAERQRWVRQSREARDPATHERETEDEPRRKASEVHLGMLESEEGGGLAEESQHVASESDVRGEGDFSKSDHTEQWEDAGAEDMEEHEEHKGPGWFGKQKANMRNDRMSERGVYQAKVARTGKWYVYNFLEARRSKADNSLNQAQRCIGPKV